MFTHPSKDVETYLHYVYKMLKNTTKAKKYFVVFTVTCQEINVSVDRDNVN